MEELIALQCDMWHEWVTLNTLPLAQTLKWKGLNSLYEFFQKVKKKMFVTFYLIAILSFIKWDNLPSSDDKFIEISIDWLSSKELSENFFRI